MLSKVIASSLKYKFTPTPVTSTLLRGVGKRGWRDLLTSQAHPYLRHFAQKCAANSVCLHSPFILSFVLPTPPYLHLTQLKLHGEHGPLSGVETALGGEASRPLPGGALAAGAVPVLFRCTHVPSFSEPDFCAFFSIRDGHVQALPCYWVWPHRDWLPGILEKGFLLWVTGWTKWPFKILRFYGSMEGGREANIHGT